MRQRIKNESSASARQRETKYYVERVGRYKPWIIVHVSIVVLIVLVRWFRLHSFWCETPFRSSPQNGGRNFRLSSHRRVWCTTDCLYYVASGRQLTPFLVFYPAPTALTSFSFEFSSANQNSLSIRCWYFSIFNPGVPNFFYTFLNSIIGKYCQKYL